MLKAVLWDMDGTLLDSRAAILVGMNETLEAHGLPPFTAARLDLLIGRPLRDILATQGGDRELVERMAHDYRVRSVRLAGLVQVFPGLGELVADLRRRDIRMGVVTSKGQEETVRLLADLGIAHWFDCIVGDDDRRPLKPDPAPVRDACSLLGCGPAEAAMVGDTRFDMESARAAGAWAIGVLWGQQDAAALRAAGAHALVRDAAELAAALDAAPSGRPGQ